MTERRGNGVRERMEWPETVRVRVRVRRREGFGDLREVFERE